MKKSLVQLARKLGFAGQIVILRNGALREWGWFRTFNHGRSEDRHGKPIAWATYAFLFFIEPRLKPYFSIFEYGCGSSTLWYADRVAKVTSVEHDSSWFNLISKRIPHNANVHLAQSDDYVSYPNQFEEKFDLIVVDGILRNECIKSAVNCIKPTGVIILDNSDRFEYRPGIQYLLDQGFKKIDFYGMFPVTPLAGTTTVFYRLGNCLDI